MTVSMPSVIFYPASDSKTSYTDHITNANSLGDSCDVNINHAKSESRFANANTGLILSSQSVTNTNLNAAIASSLKLGESSHALSRFENVSADLLNRSIAFHRSTSTPLDTLIRTKIEKMPNSRILIAAPNEDGDAASILKNGKKTLFSDADLLQCCLKAKAALPQSNIGLQNAGNTCYLNSVLQCLLATGPLLFYVREKHNHSASCAYLYGKSSNGMRRFCALCALFRLYQEHSRQGSTLAYGSGGMYNRCNAGQITPSDFVSNVRAVCPNLRVYQQEDAHEYLLGILSKMEDSVLSAYGKLPRALMDTNVIRRIFGGTTRSEVTCSTCHRVSPRNDQWFNLSMDITHARSLKQCLYKYTEPEILQGANAYKCETCKQLRHATRRCRIAQSPPILVVQFNRFSRSQKLDMRVEFPASFDMRPHMNCQGAPANYRLFATLNHEGYSCRSGHYIAFSRRNNQWFSHNDSYVSPTTQEYVLRQAPYLLFYELVSMELITQSTVSLNQQQASTICKSPKTCVTLLRSPLAHTPPTLLPTLPVRPLHSNSIKPAAVFLPRVLCKPLTTGLIPASNGLVKTSEECCKPDANGAPVITDGAKIIPKPISAPVFEDGASSVFTLKPSTSFSEPTAKTQMKSEQSRSVSPTIQQLDSNEPTIANGLRTENSKPRTCRSRSASNSSSGTGDSVVWVPVTQADLLGSSAMVSQTPSEFGSERKRKHSNHRKHLAASPASSFSDHSNKKRPRMESRSKHWKHKHKKNKHFKRNTRDDKHS